MKTKKKSKILASQVKQIINLSRQGLTERAIAAKVGVSRSSVWHYKNKHIQEKYSDKELAKH